MLQAASFVILFGNYLTYEEKGNPHPPQNFCSYNSTAPQHAHDGKHCPHAVHTFALRFVSVPQCRQVFTDLLFGLSV